MPSLVESAAHLCTLLQTSRFVFALPEGTSSGLTVASALVCKAAKEGEGLNDKGKPVIRPYTPVTAPDVTDKLELLIKHYKGGAFTEYLWKLKPGDSISMKGALATFAWWPVDTRADIVLVQARSPSTRGSRTSTSRSRASSCFRRALSSSRPADPFASQHDRRWIWYYTHVRTLVFLDHASPLTPLHFAARFRWQVLQAIECVGVTHSARHAIAHAPVPAAPTPRTRPRRRSSSRT